MKAAEIFEKNLVKTIQVRHSLCEVSRTKTKMKTALLFSGGKDSCYALFKVKKEDTVKCLISFKSENDSYMFHYPNIELVKEQAKLLDIPLIFKETNNKEELNDLKNTLQVAIEEYNIEGVYSGALASNFQREKIKKICDELNLKSINPLWHIDPITYLNDLIKNKFKIIITGIAADGFTKDFLGKEMDKDMINKLIQINKINKINIHGEGGEYETLVVNCPLFKEELKINKSEIIMESKNTGILLIN